VDNAAKFADKDPAEVSVSASGACAGMIGFAVRDNGPGIPHEYFDRIFEGFVQVEERVTGQVPGLGVGLALARQLVEACGGSISVQSTMGEGSVFTFVLPSQSAPPIAEADA
jgi:signal transduction histidine kinase